MAKEGIKDFFTNFDTPYQTQPPKGSAEGPIDYGKVTNLPATAADPLGVLPEQAKQHNVGPKEGLGH